MRYCALILSIVLVFQSAKSLNAYNELHKANPLIPPLSQYPRFFVNLISMGHIRLYEDFLHIWLIQYLSNQNEETPEVVGQRIRYTLKFKPYGKYIYLLSAFYIFDKIRSLEETIKTYELGLKLHPDSWRLHICLANIYLNYTEDKHTAVPHFEKAYELHPDKPILYKNIAQKIINNEKIYYNEKSRSDMIFRQVSKPIIDEQFD